MYRISTNFVVICFLNCFKVYPIIVFHRLQSDNKIELTEESKLNISEKLRTVSENTDSDLKVKITYFVPDKRKAGGAYVDVSAIVERIDEYERCIVMTEGTKIPIEQIRAIEGELFSCYE